mgnify:CR=1 FL=1
MYNGTSNHALSNKFLIQVTEELGLSRSGFTLANTILQGLGIFISPMVSSRLAKGDMRKIQCVSIIGFALSYASYSLAQNAIHLYISSVFIWSILVKFCTDSSKYDDHKLVC